MSEPISSSSYAGDISASDAWRVLEGQANARLIDVRTSAEWAFVGLPDLSTLRRPVEQVEWQVYPSMQQNPNFVAEVERAGADKSAPLLFLCRSGGRSRLAAIAATAAGYTRAYNVAGGFEGDLDGERHRGRMNGWKAAGLPWKQS